jgi:hypothetical protein
MMTHASTICERRLSIVLELFDAGVDLQRQRLRRLHPRLTTDEIELMVRGWVRRDTEPLDATGTVKPAPPSTACTR